MTETKHKKHGTEKTKSSGGPPPESGESGGPPQKKLKFYIAVGEF